MSTFDSHLEGKEQWISFSGMKFYPVKDVQKAKQEALKLFRIDLRDTIEREHGETPFTEYLIKEIERILLKRFGRME